jgi:4-amino-4-deoxy-L-arabinose transferase-like glycosyltransferase
MWCMGNPAQKRYVVRMIWAGFFCMLFSLAAVLGIRHGHVAGFPSYLLALLPALPVAWTLVMTGAYLSEEKDEFRRNLYIQAILCGVAATLAVVTAWGYMEDFGRAPHLRLAWVYPMFWIFVAAAFPLVARRYR